MKKIITLLILFSIGYAVQAQSSGNSSNAPKGLPPAITSFTPKTGAPGSSITINGSNFSSTLLDNTVFIGGVKATVTNATSNSLTFTVPYSAPVDFITYVNTSGNQCRSSKKFITQASSPGFVSSGMFGSTTPAYTTAGYGVDGGDDMLFSDFDGDGKVDIVTFPEENKMYVFRNTATALNTYNFTKSQVSFGSSYFDENHAAIADMDNDGDMDIVIHASAADYSNNNGVYLLTNISTSGSISFSVSTLFIPSYKYEACIDLGDMNGDGFIDLVLPTSYGNYRVYLNDGMGTFTLSATVALTNWGRVQAVELADLNEDGMLDVLYAGEYNSGSWYSQIMYSLNTTSGGAFSMANGVMLSSGCDRYCNDIEVVDLNGDNLPDVTYFAGDYLYGFRNTNTVSGTASFASRQPLVSYSSWGGYFTGKISMADITADGKPEPFGTCWYIATAHNNSSSGTLSMGSSVSPASPNSWASHIFDIDGDGDYENIASDRTTGALEIFTASPAEMDVRVSSTSYAVGSTYDFGSYNVGNTSSSKYFYVYNEGDLDLNLTGSPMVTISGVHAGDFAITQTGLASPVSGGSNDNFYIRFTPSDGGTRIATISIANNDGDENPYTINLTGTGVLTSNAWNGNFNNDWTYSLNWQNGVPDAADDVTIPANPSGPHYPNINTTTIKCHDLTIEAGANLTASNGSTLTVGGEWIDNQGISLTAGEVVFRSGSAQTITGTTSFNSLFIDNASGVSASNAISARDIVYLWNGLFSCSSDLTLSSGASYQGLISNMGSGTFSGNVNQEVYYSSDQGYRYLSAPIQHAPYTSWGDDMNNFLTGNPWNGNDPNNPTTPFPTFYQYNETATDSNWVIGWEAVPAGSLSMMRGYVANMGGSGSPFVADAVGSFNQDASYSIPLTYTSTPNNPSAEGWNLVGNPYPSELNWDGTGWTKTNVADAIYVFSPNGAYTGQYSSYIGGVGTNGGTNIIPPMAAFFVKATAAGTLGVSKSSRIAGTPPIKNIPIDPIIRLSATIQNGSKDELVVRLNANAGSGIDINMEASKIMNSGDAPNLYAMTQNEAQSIIAFNSSFNQLDIPVYFETESAGMYTLDLTETLNLDPNINIYLLDLLTNTSQNLSTNPVYSFTARQNDNAARFRITLSMTSTGIENHSVAADIWSANGSLFVFIPEEQNVLEVYDLSGKLVMKKDNTVSGTSQIGTSTWKDAVYMVRLTTKNETITRKVLIH